jgi:hypothetical protein
MADKNGPSKNLLLGFEEPATTGSSSAPCSAAVALEEFITEQLQRLGQLDRPPRKIEQAAELRTALRKYPSRTAIQNFLDGWLEEQHEWPKPADLYTYLRQISRNPQYIGQPKARPAIFCHICKDVGCYEKDTRQVRCDCIVGQELDPGMFDGPTDDRAIRRPTKDLANILALRPPARKPSRRK